jgi:hypothetical protein
MHELSGVAAEIERLSGPIKGVVVGDYDADLIAADPPPPRSRPTRGTTSEMKLSCSTS